MEQLPSQTPFASQGGEPVSTAAGAPSAGAQRVRFVWSSNPPAGTQDAAILAAHEIARREPNRQLHAAVEQLISKLDPEKHAALLNKLNQLNITLLEQKSPEKLLELLANLLKELPMADLHKLSQSLGKDFEPVISSALLEQRIDEAKDNTDALKEIAKYLIAVKRDLPKATQILRSQSEEVRSRFFLEIVSNDCRPEGETYVGEGHFSRLGKEKAVEVAITLIPDAVCKVEALMKLRDASRWTDSLSDMAIVAAISALLTDPALQREFSTRLVALRGLFVSDASQVQSVWERSSPGMFILFEDPPVSGNLHFLPKKRDQSFEQAKSALTVGLHTHLHADALLDQLVTAREWAFEQRVPAPTEAPQSRQAPRLPVSNLSNVPHAAFAQLERYVVEGLRNAMPNGTSLIAREESGKTLLLLKNEFGSFTDVNITQTPDGKFFLDSRLYAPGYAIKADTLPEAIDIFLSRDWIGQRREITLLVPLSKELVDQTREMAASYAEVRTISSALSSSKKITSSERNTLSAELKKLLQNVASASSLNEQAITKLKALTLNDLIALKEELPPRHQSLVNQLLKPFVALIELAAGDAAILNARLLQLLHEKALSIDNLIVLATRQPKSATAIYETISRYIQEGKPTLSELAELRQTAPQLTQVINTALAAIFSRIVDDYESDSTFPPDMKVFQNRAILTAFVEWSLENIHGPGDANEVIALLRRMPIEGEAKGLLTASRDFLYALSLLPIEQFPKTPALRKEVWELCKTSLNVAETLLLVKLWTKVPSESQKQFIGYLTSILNNSMFVKDSDLRLKVLEKLYAASDKQLVAISKNLAAMLQKPHNKVDELQFVGTMTVLTSSELVNLLLDEKQDLKSINHYRFVNCPTGTVARGSKEYQIRSIREEFEANPRHLLKLLTEKFDNNVDALRVYFTGERGQDEGGIGRGFISDLFPGVLGALHCKREGGFFRPALSKVVNQEYVFDKDEQDGYRQLGALMMFCLNARYNYPIGALFDTGFYGAIIAFAKLGVDRDFDAVCREKFDALFEILEVLNSGSEQGRRMMAGMRSLYPKNQEEREDLMSEQMKRLLAPVYELANGMKSAPFTKKVSWGALQTMKPEQLATQLQGSLSRDEVVANLRFDAAYLDGSEPKKRIPEEKQEWLKKWVRETSKENLEQFLYTLTGATSLGSLQLYVYNVQNITSQHVPAFFHTCGGQVDFPFHQLTTYEQFKESFELYLGGTKKSNIA